MDKEGRDAQRKDGETTSRKSVAHPGCKVHGIGAYGRVCGGYLPVVARKADDDVYMDRIGTNGRAWRLSACSGKKR